MQNRILVSETSAKIGEKITVAGWVHARRDHGGLIFIDLRDFYGITQVVFKPENKKLSEKAAELRKEFVVSVKGKVSVRPKGMENKELKTGEIEIEADSLEIINKGLGELKAVSVQISFLA